MMERTLGQVLAQMLSIRLVLSITAGVGAVVVTRTSMTTSITAASGPGARIIAQSLTSWSSLPLTVANRRIAGVGGGPTAASGARPGIRTGSTATHVNASLLLALSQRVEAVPSVMATATVIESVHLRSGPATDTESYGTLPPDTQVAVLDQQSDWYQVQSPRGTIGWLAGWYVALNTNAVPLHPDALAAAHPAVRIAEQYVGAPYLWGGASPRGFDCSGFTQYVYRQLGVRLPRRARQQFNAWYGQAIASIDALVPGDLVFFERTTEEVGITHVGIFVGEGRMIAARTDLLGVRYVNVSEPFWSTRFVGGLRVAY